MDNVTKTAGEQARGGAGAENAALHTAAKPVHAEPVRQRADEVSLESAKAKAEQAKEAVREESKRPMAGGGTYLRFIVDQKTHEVSVMVVDRGTQQVVRRVPPKDLSEFLQDRWQAGFSVDVWA